MISGLSRKKAAFVEELDDHLEISEAVCVCFATSLNIGSE